ncbi:protein with a SET domain within carboxy region [Cryptosporidium ubiquitum]|uniref:Protein with a SET domain within carboxy region n=2 Tax=Cryptosporidium ubiquitum TaxID=857276 RepID=A0A1J4MFQ1_9CRYT|nr:protein with a SET domain within carboxy region [Cryptosporidium ubiquitum]OII71669.1 protein with a SET domain within carboxy region [Cryptosporidium ubiquitum]
MKEKKKLQEIIENKKIFKVRWTVSFDSDSEYPIKNSNSKSKYWKYEQDGFREEGWDKELGIPKVILSEVENLMQGRALYIRNASHYGQRRLDSVLNNSIIMEKGKFDIDLMDTKRSQVSEAPQSFENTKNECSKTNLSQDLPHSSTPNFPNHPEESFYALIDEVLQEGSTCTVVYPSEYSGKWEAEHFQVFHFSTIKKSLNRLLDLHKSERLFVSYFSDVKISQYCPTIFWNIVRIFHGEIDVGIIEIFSSIPIAMLKRKRSTVEIRFNEQNPSSSLNKRSDKNGPCEDKSGYKLKKSKDIFQELSQKLIQDLNTKIPYFEKNGIEYFKDSDYLDLKQKNKMSQENSDFENNLLFNREIDQSSIENQISRRSSRRVSFGVNDEISIIEATIDKNYKIIRLPIYNYPEKWKKIIYKYCILNEIHSCTLIKKDSFKGRCVIAGSFIRKDDFVLEYKGNLITHLTEAKELEKKYALSNKGCYMYYFKYNDKNYCIDATEENLEFGPGRLINHSKKNPNIITKVLIVGTTPRLFFVSKRNIMCGEELLFDYGDNNPISTLHNPWLLNS